MMLLNDSVVECCGGRTMVTGRREIPMHGRTRRESECDGVKTE